MLRRTCQAMPQLTARIMARIGDVRTGPAETRPPIVDRLVEASDISPISALLSRMIDDCDDLTPMSARLGPAIFVRRTSRRGPPLWPIETASLAAAERPVKEVQGLLR